jgi:hypothetical protein
LALFLHPFHHQYPIAFQRQVAIFIAKEIHVAFFVDVLVGEVLKIETGIYQFLPGEFAHFFTGWNLPFQYASVVAQYSIYFFDYSGVFSLKLVIVLGAAVVIAKFFVDAAFERFATAKALL